jgi:hypothetical protein
LPVVSHQTIKLSKGKHSSPEHGACVMELASMLAGERFTDHPRSVSRTVAALLRGYNDLLDDPRRQDLYSYAARCVGTANGRAAEQVRIERLIAWADELSSRAAREPWWGRLGRARSRRRSTDPESAASYALRALHRAGSPHREVLALIDELIALGAERPEPMRLPAVDQAAARRASSSLLWASSDRARRSSLRTAS